MDGPSRILFPRLPFLALSCLGFHHSTKGSPHQTSESQDLVWKVVRRLFDVTGGSESLSTTRASEALQVFAEGKVYLQVPKGGSAFFQLLHTADGTPPRVTPTCDAYYILLATQLLHRILWLDGDHELKEIHQLRHQSDSSSLADRLLVIAALSDGLSRILAADIARLEKASLLPTSRSTLARAVLTTTVAALHCLKRQIPQFSTSMEQEQQQQQIGGEATALGTAVLRGAIGALDRLVHLYAETAILPAVDWDADLASDLEGACRNIGSNETEDAVLRSLEELEGGFLVAAARTSSSPSKRSPRTSRRSKSNSPKASPKSSSGVEA